MKSDRSDSAVPVLAPDLLLPGKGVDMHLWATVACDQYTSEPAYWQRVAARTKDVPSTAHLMLPELYLDEPDADARIDAIHRTMETYLQNGVFECLPHTAMLVRRQTPYAPCRTGLMLAFDLEAYDFRRGSGSLIRATEGTVAERIPPRMKIRRNAALEMPHILILIDDPERTVIEPLAAAVQAGVRPAYDFDLMENGGHVTGYPVSDSALLRRMTEALAALADPAAFCSRYGLPAETPPLLFAVGDGNHSLASAKCHYEEHPTPLTRYALAELVNLHDCGIRFEPIHRVLFGADPADLESAFLRFYGSAAACTDGADGAGEAGCAGEAGDAGEAGCALGSRENGAPHRIRVLSAREARIWTVRRTVHTLAVGALQDFLDAYIASHPGVRIDYIHGADAVQRLAETPGNTGFILPATDKGDLFPTVIRSGALPRKTFSMGEACEKRYYLECRRLAACETGRSCTVKAV